MKTINYIKLLALASICFTFTACDSGGEKDADLFFAYSTENLLSDWNYRVKKDEYGFELPENEQFMKRGKTLKMSCIKGENEGIQLIVHANRYINEFDFELPTMKCGENVLPKESISVAAAWYQYVSGSNERDAYAGYYPDALIPLANYQFRRFNHIEKDRNQALYFNFQSTADMVPGKYTGEGTLILDGNRTQIPFEITIYDAVMPDATHIKSGYLIWYEQIQKGEKQNTNLDLQMKYYDFEVSKGLSPDGLPEAYESTPESFANNFYQYVAKNPKIASYRMPVKNLGTNAENITTRIRSYLTALINKNKEVVDAGENLNFFEKLYFYVDDEPTAAKYDEVRLHDKLIYDVKQECLSMLDDYPALKESLRKMPNIVTTPFNDSLIATPTQGGVQTWCPQFSHFGNAESRAIYAERQQSNDRDGGEGVWWYGCMDPISPFCSYHLNADLLNSRLITYMTFEYNISGLIYWCICYYSKHFHQDESARDIWYDPICWDNCAGDGCLVYPGLEFGINGPITTLRMESICAGNEEYEYLWMIDQAVNSYNQDKGTSYNARELLHNKYFASIYKDVFVACDDDQFDANRRNLLELVELISKDRDAGVAKLISEKGE